jgi:hypothetical protein
LAVPLPWFATVHDTMIAVDASPVGGPVKAVGTRSGVRSVIGIALAGRGVDGEAKKKRI